MSGSGFAQFIPLILIFVIFYFFLIRPQQKKVKEHKIMVSALKRGDEVVTSGGIVGKVERILGDDKIDLLIAENVTVQKEPPVTAEEQTPQIINISDISTNNTQTTSTATATITKDDVAIAKSRGFEGDPCDECGQMMMVRNGTCLKCVACGTTTGCS